MALSLITTECKRYGCMKTLLACYANCRFNSRCDELRKEIEGKAEDAERDINAYLKGRGSSPISIQFPKRGVKFITLKSNIQSDRQPRMEKGREKNGWAALPGRGRQPITSPKPAPAIKPASKAAPEPVRKALPKAARRVEAAATKGRGSKQTRKIGSRSVQSIEPATPKKRRTRLTAGRKTAAAVKVAGERKSARPELKAQEKVATRIAMARRSGKMQENTAVEKDTPMAGESETRNLFEGKQQVKQPKKPRKKQASAGRAGAKGRKKSYIILDGKSATVVDEMGLIQHLVSGASPTARYFEAYEVEARVQIVPKG